MTMPDQQPRSLICTLEREDTDIHIPQKVAMEQLSSSLSTVRAILYAMPEKYLPGDRRVLALHYHALVEQYVEEIAGRMKDASSH